MGSAVTMQYDFLSPIHKNVYRTGKAAIKNVETPIGSHKRVLLYLYKYPAYVNDPRIFKGGGEGGIARAPTLDRIKRKMEFLQGADNI